MSFIASEWLVSIIVDFRCFQDGTELEGGNDFETKSYLLPWKDYSIISLQRNSLLTGKIATDLWRHHTDIKLYKQLKTKENRYFRQCRPVEQVCVESDNEAGK